MARPDKLKACVACTRAKRRCDKNVPECRRCTEKGLGCRYPAPRVTPPYDIVYASDGTASTSLNALTDSYASAPSRSLPHPPTASYTQQDLDFNRLSPASSSKSDFTSSVLSTPWFLEPTSWHVDPCLSGTFTTLSFCEPALYYFNDKLRDWLKQWATTGHCPLIHAKLYKGEMPDCIQDAYTALVTYLNRTPATEKLALRIIEHCAERLMQEHTSGTSPCDMDVLVHTTEDHLARTLALLIYKVVGLLDGDIRSRAKAEKNIQVLTLWSDQLYQSAGLDVSSGNVTTSPDEPKQQLDPSATTGAPTPPPKQLRIIEGDVSSTWEAWMLSETIRRTYLVAKLVEGGYTMLKQGWAECPGGIVFTAGQGLWDMQSPYTWFDRLRKVNVFNVRKIEAEQIFAESDPCDVDEYSHLVFTTAYGLQRMEQWKSEKEGIGIAF